MCFWWSSATPTDHVSAKIWVVGMLDTSHICCCIYFHCILFFGIIYSSPNAVRVSAHPLPQRRSRFRRLRRWCRLRMCLPPPLPSCRPTCITTALVCSRRATRRLPLRQLYGASTSGACAGSPPPLLYRTLVADSSTATEIS